jgi:hypothetical protein
MEQTHKKQQQLKKNECVTLTDKRTNIQPYKYMKYKQNLSWDFRQTLFLFKGTGDDFVDYQRNGWEKWQELSFFSIFVGPIYWKQLLKYAGTKILFCQ